MAFTVNKLVVVGSLAVQGVLGATVYGLTPIIRRERGPGCDLRIVGPSP
jgi:hypothetical protein